MIVSPPNAGKGAGSETLKVFLAPVFLVLVTFILIRPLGEFPINDDWQYSHVTKQLFETGRFQLDVPVAPALVGQAYLAQPWIHLFGFSHLSLRCLTILVSAGFLFCCVELLRMARTATPVILLAISLIAINPLFLHLEMSFMTEMYGFTLAFVGALSWLRGGQSSLGLKMLGALLIGASFSIRQFCVITFPALLIADFAAADKHRHGMRLWLRDALLGSCAVTGAIGSYLLWARQTGNLRGEFTGPLLHMLVPTPRGLVVHVAIASLYLLFFMAPLLILLPNPVSPRGKRWPWWVFGALVLAGVVYLGLHGNFPYVPRSNYTKHFPFLGNVLTPYGVGPLTTTDAYFDPHGGLQYWAWPWVVLEVSLLGLVPWARRHYRWNRVRVFGLALAIMCFLAVNQAYRDSVFDRYYFPTFLGALLFVTAGSGDRGAMSGWRKGLGVTFASVLAFYSVWGMHDYFRWNEARWNLVERAGELSVPTTELDGGYEYSGWMYYEHPERAGRECGPRTSFFCSHLRYTIGWTVRDGENVVAREPVHAWLFHFPDLMLVDRHAVRGRD